MHGLHPLIVDLTLIAVYAALTTLLFKKLKQPMVLGYLLAGIFAGPYFNLVPTVVDRDNLNLWADVGIIFLLFSLGLEFSLKKMITIGKSAMITATLNIFFMLFVGYYVGMFIGWTTADSFFLGSMISMSSTTIIIKAFDDLNIKKQKFTDLVFGVLIVEDIMGVLLLVLLPTIAIGKGINSGMLGLSVLKLLTFLILCFALGIYLIPSVLRKMKDFLNEEMLLLVAVALCLSLVTLAVYFGFSSALGAFIMGSILSETAVTVKLEHIIKPLKDFFGAVFFVTVGMMVDPQMCLTYAYPIIIITLVVISGQVLFSTFGFVISGQNLKTAVSGAFSLAQVGEFAFIIAALGMSLGVLDSFVYPIIVTVSVITTFLTPIMIKSAGKVYPVLEKALPQRWLQYINQNTKNNNPASIEDKLWQDLFRNTLIRVFLFSFIMSGIIFLVNQGIRPHIHHWFPNLAARIITTAVALLMMAPFLKGLVGWNGFAGNRFKNWLQSTINNTPFRKIKTKDKASAGNHLLHLPQPLKNAWHENTGNMMKFVSKDRISRIYILLWSSHKNNRVLLLILTSFRLLVVSFFIVTAVHQFLTENPRVIFILLLASVLLISRSQWLLNQYIKIEHQFLDNLQGDKQNNSEGDK